MSHLELKVNNRPLVLDDNFQLAIEDANPLFNDHTMYSYPVTIPLDGNRHYVRNIEDPASDIRPVDLEHAAMQINVEGIPFRSGTAIISEDEHLTNRLSLNIDANEVSFSDLIADLNCRDVKVKDDIIIGHKLSNLTINADYELGWKTGTSSPMSIVDDRGEYIGPYDEGHFELPRAYKPITGEMRGEYEPQALGFSVPDVIGFGEATYVDRVYQDGKTIKVPSRQRAYINTSRPYGETDERTGQPVTYCNARVCYKHYALNKESDPVSTADYNVSRVESANAYEDIYPYWVLDADRPQSGICFYVLYFLDCLFHQIGYTFDNSELLDVEDLKRLCFYTTRCRYDIRKEDINMNTHIDGKTEEINQWLDARGCGGNFAFDNGALSKKVNALKINDKTYRAGEWYTGTVAREGGDIVRVKYRIDSIDVSTEITSARLFGDILPMYANSDNFPDMSVTSLLQSLESQFGIRFLVDEDKHHVRATFFRNVFRDTRPPVNFPMQIDSISPISEKITGVKVGYSAESDDKEQRANLRNSVRDYNTDYDYIDYNKERLVTGLDLYKQIFRSPGNNDMHIYVDLSTGNRYRIKVDSEATQISELHPVIYQVGQHHHVEFGDCREINSDYIHELRSELIPVPLNDVNYYNEASTASGKNDDVVITDKDGHTTVGTISGESVTAQPILVPYCDEDMEHEFVEQRINNVISEGLADAYLTTVLRLQESYDPTKTDDGNSPLQSYDWGNAIAIMRGGGDPEKDGVMYYDNNYDGFQNSKWRVSAQDYQISTDNIDQFCGGYEYKGEQFSLKPRAYVTVPWQPQGVTASAPEADGYDLVVDDPDIKDRGYADHFLREYIHFLLHRKPYVIEGKAEAALLATIPEYWTRRFRIGTMIGYINRVTYNIDVKTGIRKCQIYFYA